MPIAATAAPHIRLDQRGRAWLDDTNVKVIEVVLSHLAYGWSAEVIQEYHPHLTLPQVYAALAYYYDHQEILGSQMVEQEQQVQTSRAAAGESPLQKRLRQRKQAR